jgi:hypothetical protein
MLSLGVSVTLLKFFREYPEAPGIADAINFETAVKDVVSNSSCSNLGLSSGAESTPCAHWLAATRLV